MAGCCCRACNSYLARTFFPVVRRWILPLYPVGLVYFNAHCARRYSNVHEIMQKAINSGDTFLTSITGSNYICLFGGGQL